MIQDSRNERYLNVGDRLVRRGKFKTAVAVYSRYADACVAERCLHHAREVVERDPVGALRALAKVEELVGPTGEARRITATAYTKLGHPEIADRYRRASN